METTQPLEELIEEWRTYVRRRREFHPVDIEELEDHLRTQVKSLVEVGLAGDEAFLVAVKRLGAIDSLSREFAREYSERLWKQLVVLPESGESTSDTKREAMVAIGLAMAAGFAIKLPEISGMHLWDSADSSFYARNFSLFVLPFLAGYFAWKRSLHQAGCIWLAAPFVAAALVMNIIPFKPDGHTEVLSALHLPIALWLAVGFAYTGGHWRDHDRCMNFVRFTGEWFIYYTLIALGGVILMIFTLLIFDAIDIPVGWFLNSWLQPCGIVGAVLISAWLVEAKQIVI